MKPAKIDFIQTVVAFVKSYLIMLTFADSNANT